MSEQRPFAAIFGPALARYLALKETLGRRYRTERRVFENLDAFFAARSADTDLSPETFAQRCSTQEYLTSGVRRFRMRIVRNLCLYRRWTEPSCFVPDVALFPANSADTRGPPARSPFSFSRRTPGSASDFRDGADHFTKQYCHTSLRKPRSAESFLPLRLSNRGLA